MKSQLALSGDLVAAVHSTRVSFSNPSRSESWDSGDPSSYPQARTRRSLRAQMASGRNLRTKDGARTRLPGARNRRTVRGFEKAAPQHAGFKSRLRIAPRSGFSCEPTRKHGEHDADHRSNSAGYKLRLSWRRGLIRLPYGRGDAGLAGIFSDIAHFLLRIVERLLLVGYFLLILCIFLIPLSLIA
jgi:hypothetical protein